MINCIIYDTKEKRVISFSKFVFLRLDLKTELRFVFQKIFPGGNFFAAFLFQIFARVAGISSACLPARQGFPAFFRLFLSPLTDFFILVVLVHIEIPARSLYTPHRGGGFYFIPAENRT
jgi:hypothetical protein